MNTYLESMADVRRDAARQRHRRGCHCTLRVQGHLAHKKPPPNRTKQLAYAQGPMVVLGGGGLPYDRGTPVIADVRTEVPLQSQTFS